MIEAQKAEAEQGQLLAKYAQTTNAKERADIRANLAKVLERQFDLQQGQREREVSQIEARVKKLREMIQKRRIAQAGDRRHSRVDQLLNEVDGMGWVAPSGAGRSTQGPYGARTRLPSRSPCRTGRPRQPTGRLRVNRSKDKGDNRK